MRGIEVVVELLESIIRERFHKRVDYHHLINISNFEDQNKLEPIITRRGDLIIPLTNKTTYWGQLVVYDASDMNSERVTQLKDLVDLYFSAQVTQWVHEPRLPKVEYSYDVKPHLILVKSSQENRSHYVLSYLQDKLMTLGTLPWNSSLELNDPELYSILLYIKSVEELTYSEVQLISQLWSKKSLLNGEAKLPHLLIFFDKNSKAEAAWNQLSVSELDAMEKIEIDLDRMPIALSELREAIDLCVNV